jgi:colanic acid biosynthesis glycosyl transferase WcaI
MRLLIYGINFSPELTGIGKYTGEMATWLTAQGHQVRVVTAPPYYPQWHIAEGYTNWWWRDNDKNSNGISHAVAGSLTVYRCPLWVPTKVSGLKRLVHLASFALSSAPILITQLFWRPDVVWMVAPAFFCAPSAWLTAKLSGAKCWLHIQDYEVDAAFDLGLLKGKRLRQWVTAIECLLLRRFNVVSTISQRMLERAVCKGVVQAKAVLFPNWVDISDISPDSNIGIHRAELGIDDDTIVALYSGNMGAKQGLEILSQAAERLQRDSSLVFIFCGSGVGRADLVARCSGLANVHFLDLQPLEKLGALLTTADIHLLPQRADAADLVMPSKLTGMLASGRPVVATAHEGTELARVVAGCGVVVPPEDPEAFANAIAALAGSPAERARHGRAARMYAEKNLARDAVLKQFEQQLITLREDKRP